MDEPEHEVVVSFPDLSIGEANLAALELRSELLNRLPDGVSAELSRQDERTMNVGETLVLIFSTGAALAIAEGIRSWLVGMGTGSTVEIRTNGGELIATGGAAQKLDVAKTVSELRKHKR